MVDLPPSVLYYGTESPLPPRTALRAGPLEMTFESGDLRYIRLGRREVIRRIYVAVRDRNWGTAPVELADLKIEAEARSFRISYAARNRLREIDFAWQGEILGREDGTLSFSMDGTARATFLRNRIGFCILHPVRECAGAACVVEKEDGSVERSTFPVLVAPSQPFADMRAFSHEVWAGLWAELRFSGDLFEMEDQRNWADGSFKIYCTPLRLPFPVEIAEGTRVTQSVSLALKGAIPRGISLGAGQAVSISLAPTRLGRRIPALGLGMSSDATALHETEIHRLRAMHLQHLRVDLKPHQGDCGELLENAARQARAIGCPLELAVTLTDRSEHELRRLADLLRDVRPPVCRCLVYHATERSTPEGCIRLAREVLRTACPDSKLGAGSDAELVFINRRRPPAELLDLLCYSVNPQVHAFDNASLVENLEGLRPTIATARRLGGGVPIAVSPVTLRRRFNPDATSPPAPPPEGELPPQVDVRQMSLFGAAWTVGALAALCVSGVRSITWYETAGWRGVMESRQGSRLPARFRSVPGTVFPVYHVLADAAEWPHAQVVATTVDRPLEAAAFAIENQGCWRVLVANLTGGTLPVALSIPSRNAMVKHLDDLSARSAMAAPEEYRAAPGEQLTATAHRLELELKPYAVARVGFAAGNGARG